MKGENYQLIRGELVFDENQCFKSFTMNRAGVLYVQLYDPIDPVNNPGEWYGPYANESAALESIYEIAAMEKAHSLKAELDAYKCPRCKKPVSIGKKGLYRTYGLCATCGEKEFTNKQHRVNANGKKELERAYKAVHLGHHVGLFVEDSSPVKMHFFATKHGNKDMYKPGLLGSSKLPRIIGTRPETGMKHLVKFWLNLIASTNREIDDVDDVVDVVCATVSKSIQRYIDKWNSQSYHPVHDGSTLPGLPLKVKMNLDL